MKKMKRFLVLCLVAAMCLGTMIIPARAAVFGPTEAGQYVDQLYSGLLGRTADDQGRLYHVNRLVNDKASAASVAEAIISSAEFRARPLTNDEFVEALYLGLLGRPSAGNEKDGYVTAMKVGQSRTWVFQQFIASAEFKQLCEQQYSMFVGTYSTNPNIPNAAPTSVTTSKASDYVRDLYLGLLGREPDQEGLDYWTAQLTLKKMSASGVAAGIAAGNEFNSKSYTNGDFVQRAYVALLGREPDPTGFANFVNALNSGKTRAWVFAAICASNEFQNRYLFNEMNAAPGTINSTTLPNSNISGGAVNTGSAADYVYRLYQNFTTHSPDPAGDEVQYWVKKLENHTMSAAAVAAGIAGSAEARGIARTREDFINSCYYGLLNRGPDASGMGTWTNAMANGYSRSWVFAKICSSAEFQNSTEFRNMNVTAGYVNASGYDMG